MKTKVYKLEKFVLTFLSQFGDLLAGRLTCTGMGHCGNGGSENPHWKDGHHALLLSDLFST